MLKEMIDDFYLKREQDRKQDHFYVTDAGKCPRQIFFSIKGYPRRSMEPHVLRLIHHGNVVHTRLMGTLYSMGIVKATEIEIPPQEIINGRADAIVTMDGQDYVVEIKSMNSFAFERLDRASPDHVKQINLYMHYFNIPKGLLIYENKNTQELKEFEVGYNQELVSSILAFFSNLKHQIDMNQLPEKPAGLEPWRCEYCPYIEECRKAGT